MIDDLSAQRRSDLGAVLREQRIETPSWAFGNSGTRFKFFNQAGAARNAYEKVEDAAQVHKWTGVAPSVALHIPWDRVDDYGALAKHAADLGLEIGAINPNVFQEPEYRLGSVCNPDPRVQRQAIGHLLDCVDIAKQTGSKILSLWFADGINYPGQDNLVDRQKRLGDALKETYDALEPDMRLLLEYKPFEPAFYATDVPDWGTSLLHCERLGLHAQVLVDTGHHAPGTNIEFIVAVLAASGKLGGFHFNSRFYGDDDLMVGAADPFQLFRIMFEIVSADGLDRDRPVAFMIDQCHNIEPKIPAEIRSVMNVQEATAKALLVDREALADRQATGDVLGAHAALMDVYNSDVRPLLADLRVEMGIDPDPLAAYARSGYAEKIRAERPVADATGWGQ